MSRANKSNPAGSTAGQSSGVGRMYFNADGKVAASLSGKTLRKKVRASRHLLRQPPAWAFDVSILEAARQDGAQTVEVADVESRKVYKAPILAFFIHGVRIDRGFGQQIALPLALWRVEAEDAQQLCLFGEIE